MRLVGIMIGITVCSLCSAQPIQASVITLLTSDDELTLGGPNQGYFGNDINNPFPINHALDNTYTVDWSGSVKQRDYFSFLIPSSLGPITAATLELQRGGTEIEGAGVMYHLGSVSTDALTLSQNKGTRNLAIYNDLGAGTTYGDFPISDPTIPGDIFGNYNDILQFDLNAAALHDFNAAKGSYVTLGGSLKSTVFNENLPIIGSLILFTSHPGFDTLDRPQRLVLTVNDVAPIPEPPSVVLTGFGLISVLCCAMMKRSRKPIA